jgi:hypothetical protein
MLVDEERPARGDATIGTGFSSWAVGFFDAL